MLQVLASSCFPQQIIINFSRFDQTAKEFTSITYIRKKFTQNCKQTKNRSFSAVVKSYLSRSENESCNILRPRPHVSGYFRIRNFFVPNTATVHTYPVNSTANPEKNKYVLQSGKKYIRNESDNVWTFFYPMT